MFRKVVICLILLTLIGFVSCKKDEADGEVPDGLIEEIFGGGGCTGDDCDFLGGGSDCTIDDFCDEDAGETITNCPADCTDPNPKNNPSNPYLKMMVGENNDIVNTYNLDLFSTIEVDTIVKDVAADKSFIFEFSPADNDIVTVVEDGNSDDADSRMFRVTGDHKGEVDITFKATATDDAEEIYEKMLHINVVAPTITVSLVDVQDTPFNAGDEPDPIQLKIQGGSGEYNVSAVSDNSDSVSADISQDDEGVWFLELNPSKVGNAKITITVSDIDPAVEDVAEEELVVEVLESGSVKVEARKIGTLDLMTLEEDEKYHLGRNEQIGIYVINGTADSYDCDLKNGDYLDLEDAVDARMTVKGKEAVLACIVRADVAGLDLEGNEVYPTVTVLSGEIEVDTVDNISPLRIAEDPCYADIEVDATYEKTEGKSGKVTFTTTSSLESYDWKITYVENITTFEGDVLTKENQFDPEFIEEEDSGEGTYTVTLGDISYDAEESDDVLLPQLEHGNIMTFRSYDLTVKAEVQGECGADGKSAEAEKLIYKLKSYAGEALEIDTDETEIVFHMPDAQISMNNHDSWMRVTVYDRYTDEVATEKIKLKNKTLAKMERKLEYASGYKGSPKISDIGAVKFKFHKFRAVNTIPLSVDMHRAKLRIGDWETYYDDDLHEMIPWLIVGGCYSGPMKRPKMKSITIDMNMFEPWRRVELETEDLGE